MPQAKIDVSSIGAARLMRLDPAGSRSPFGPAAAETPAARAGRVPFSAELEWKRAVAESLVTIEVDEETDRAAHAHLPEVPAPAVKAEAKPPGPAGLVPLCDIGELAKPKLDGADTAPFEPVGRTEVVPPAADANPLRFKMRVAAKPETRAKPAVRSAPAPAKPVVASKPAVAPAVPAKPVGPQPGVVKPVEVKAKPVVAKAPPARPVEVKPDPKPAAARPVDLKPAAVAGKPLAEVKPAAELKPAEKPKAEPNKADVKVEIRPEAKPEVAIAAPTFGGRGSTLDASPAESGGLPMAVKVGLPVAAVLALGGYFVFGGGATAPVSTTPAVSAVMGEHNWVTEWASDAAGSRRGRQLQFYRPSQTLSNYIFEFSATMESKAIGWVFRAVDTKNYYGMKIEEGRPGALQLTRFAVIDGRESSVSSKPLPVAASAATVFQVKLEANGPRFTAYVQGQPVEVWVDNRLRTGAVGLMSERDERARMITTRFSTVQ